MQICYRDASPFYRVFSSTKVPPSPSPSHGGDPDQPFSSQAETAVGEAEKRSNPSRVWPCRGGVGFFLLGACCIHIHSVGSRRNFQGISKPPRLTEDKEVLALSPLSFPNRQFSDWTGVGMQSRFHDSHARQPQLPGNRQLYERSPPWRAAPQR